jgi:hypothetical protein
MKFVIRGSSSIYGDTSLSPPEVIGTLELACATLKSAEAQGYWIFGDSFYSPCTLNFYWHDATAGVGDATDILWVDAIALIEERGDTPKITYEEFYVWGGSGRYKGASASGRDIEDKTTTS